MLTSNDFFCFPLFTFVSLRKRHNKYIFQVFRTDISAKSYVPTKLLFPSKNPLNFQQMLCSLSRTPTYGTSISVRNFCVRRCCSTHRAASAAPFSGTSYNRARSFHKRRIILLPICFVGWQKAAISPFVNNGHPLVSDHRFL